MLISYPRQLQHETGIVSRFAACQNTSSCIAIARNKMTKVRDLLGISAPKMETVPVVFTRVRLFLTANLRRLSWWRWSATGERGLISRRCALEPDPTPHDSQDGLNSMALSAPPFQVDSKHEYIVVVRCEVRRMPSAATVCYSNPLDDGFDHGLHVLECGEKTAS